MRRAVSAKILMFQSPKEISTGGDDRGINFSTGLQGCFNLQRRLALVETIDFAKLMRI